MGLKVSGLESWSYLKLRKRDVQVSVCELVADVPSKRSKLAPVLDDRMEEAEAEKQFAPFHRLAASIQVRVCKPVMGNRLWNRV